VSALAEIFRDNKFRPEDLPGFESKLFFEGDKQRPFLVKFFVLIFLSTIIVVYGVLNDSPATVIGAKNVRHWINRNSDSFYRYQTCRMVRQKLIHAAENLSRHNAFGKML